MTASSIQPQQTLQSNPVQGVWSLVSYVVEVQETGETFAPMGDHPTGYVIFTAEGRLSFTLSAQGRQPGSTAEERSDLLNSMIAYTGSYRLPGGRRGTPGGVAWATSTNNVLVPEVCVFVNRPSSCPHLIFCLRACMNFYYFTYKLVYI